MKYEAQKLVRKFSASTVVIHYPTSSLSKELWPVISSYNYNI